MSERFSYLKKGDVVVVEYSGSPLSSTQRPYEFATVIEAGAKKIKTDKGDFSIKGQAWGKDYYSYGNLLSEISVEDATKKNVLIDAENRRLKIAYKMREIDWRSLPLQTLEAIDALLNADRQAP